MPLILDNEEDTSPNVAENAVESAVGQSEITQPSTIQQQAAPSSIGQPLQMSEQPQEEPKSKGIELDNPPTPEAIEKEQLGIIDRFKLGLSQSVSGQASKGVDKIIDYAQGKEGKYVTATKKQYADPTFWQSIVQSAGEIIGDLPYIAAGGTLGAAIGSPGGPPGAVLGAGAGSMALPAFLKTAMREYHEFQEGGGDLTFGEFLERAGTVGSETLKQGTFGAILGQVSSQMQYLLKVPYLSNLFNTKYVGPVAKAATTGIRHGTALTTEAGVGTVVGAALDGRMPTQEDLAHNIVLFTGTKTAHGVAELPAKLVDTIKGSQSRNLNLSLAQQIEAENLSYPALDEFKDGNQRVYKNSVELDKNLAAFSESFVDRVTSQIQALSPKEFESSHDAGTQLKGLLKVPEEAAGAATPTLPGVAANAPVKPTRIVRPLIENPMRVAVETIADRPFSSDAEAGRQIADRYTEARREAYEPLKERYENFENEVIGPEFVDEQTISQLESFITEWEGSAVPGSQEAAVLHNARRLLGMMQVVDNEGNVTGTRAVPLRNVIKTVRSMKKVPNWSIGGEISQNLQEVITFTEEAIVRNLQENNPELATEYNELRGDYADFKRRFDNSDTRVFYDRTSSAEKIYKKFSTLDDFNQLSEAIGGTPEGDAILDRLRRDAWEKGVGRSTLDATTENEFAKSIEKLSERDFNNLMEYLTPEQQVAVLTNIRHSNNIRQAVRSNDLLYEASMRTYADQVKRHKANLALEKESAKEAKKVQAKQDLLVSLLKEDPAQLVNNMSTIEGIKRTRENLKKVNGGNDMFDALKRYETERMFDFMAEGFLRNGRVPFSEFEVQMKNKDFRAKLKELNGPEFVHQMDRLAEVTKQLSKNYKEAKIYYRNDSQTYNSIVNIATALGLAKGEIVSPGIAFVTKKGVGYGINKVSNWWEARNLNQESIKKAIEAGRAVQSRNRKNINDKARIFLTEIEKTTADQTMSK